MSRLHLWAWCCSDSASAVDIIGCLFAGLGGGGVSCVAGCDCESACWVGLSVAFVTTGGGDLAVVGACVEAAVLMAC